MKISVAPKARIRKNWREVRREMYVRCRLSGSWAMWFWLARVISGRSQQERIRRGVDKGSAAISGFMKDHPVSEEWVSQCRLTRAMIRLCVRDVGHSHLGGASQIVGNNIIVGRRIFSIVGG